MKTKIILMFVLSIFIVALVGCGNDSEDLEVIIGESEKTITDYELQITDDSKSVVASSSEGLESTSQEGTQEDEIDSSDGVVEESTDEELGITAGSAIVSASTVDVSIKSYSYNDGIYEKKSLYQTDDGEEAMKTTVTISEDKILNIDIFFSPINEENKKIQDEFYENIKKLMLGEDVSSYSKYIQINRERKITKSFFEALDLIVSDAEKEASSD